MVKIWSHLYGSRVDCSTIFLGPSGNDDGDLPFEGEQRFDEEWDSFPEEAFRQRSGLVDSVDDEHAPPVISPAAQLDHGFRPLFQCGIDIGHGPGLLPCRHGESGPLHGPPHAELVRHNPQ
jgi:hypothetical protein